MYETTYKKVQDVRSKEACACKCQDEYSCKFFTWNEYSRVCHLKRYAYRTFRKGRYKDMKGSHSGYQGCCIKRPSCKDGHSKCKYWSKIIGECRKKWMSGQQNQFCSGQQPAGHIVPSHCFLAAILTSFSFMLTNGQSAAVAAQYMLSGQQNQFCSGQQPAGHMVPSHCFLAAILTSFSFMLTNGQSAAVAAQYMLSGQQNQFCS